MLKMKRSMKTTEINTMASEGDTTLTGSINETLSHQAFKTRSRITDFALVYWQEREGPAEEVPA